MKILKILSLAFIISQLPVSETQAQRLTIDKNKIDIGQTGYEVPVTATFEMRNRGLRKLQITRVIPDCSCTRVEYPKGEIGVGDKFTIKMTYDSRQLGHFNKQAAIYSNASERPVYITMTGVVRQDLMDYSGSYPFDFNGLLADKNELEFDNVNKGDMPQTIIRVMNNGNKVMEPNIQHLPPYLSAEVSPTRLSPGHSGKVVLTLNSDKIHDYGLTQTNVYLAQRLGERVSNDREVGVSVVLLPDLRHMSGSLLPQLALSDSVLNIEFGGKQKKTVETILYNGGKAALNISSLQLFTRGLKVTLGKRVLEPGETTKLKIEAIASELKKARTRPRVLMITDDPRRPKVVITVNAK
jgi:hypothetical protein